MTEVAQSGEIIWVESRATFNIGDGSTSAVGVMASAWLNGGHGSLDGVVIPGCPGGLAATLVLSQQCVSVRAWQSQADLPWEAAATTWVLSYWAASEGGTSGAGLRASGAEADLLEPVLAALRPRRHALLDRINAPAFPGEVIVPLYVPHGARRHVQRERTTLYVLCRVLADRPELRARLHDVDRMNALLVELRDGAKDQVGEKLHLRSRRVDVRTAMDAVGLVHRYDGRPLPDGSTTWTRPSAIDAVLRRVAANRYAAGRLPSREEAAAILDREYFSVEPWPFASLFA